MDRDLIARAMQNIINMNKVQLFEQFKGNQLYTHLHDEMTESAQDADDKKKLEEDITEVLEGNKKTIEMIEQNQEITQDQYNHLMEDLRSWRRKYIIKS